MPDPALLVPITQSAASSSAQRLWFEPHGAHARQQRDTTRRAALAGSAGGPEGGTVSAPNRSWTEPNFRYGFCDRAARAVRTRRQRGESDEGAARAVAEQAAHRLR